MTSEVAFCPQCGTRRQAESRYCVKCGHRFEGGLTQLTRSAAPAVEESIPPTPPAPAPPAPAVQGAGDRSATISLIAGLAWIAAAVCFGYLAFLQLQYAPLLTGQADQLRQLALFNGIGAAITLFFGARLILGTSLNGLVGSAVWAGLGVAYGAWQISQGITHEVFLLGTLLTGVAGVLSLAAAQAVPKDL